MRQDIGVTVGGMALGTVNPQRRPLGEAVGLSGARAL